MIARKYRWTKCPKDLEKRVKILVLNWILQLEGLRFFTRLASLSILSLFTRTLAGPGSALVPSRLDVVASGNGCKEYLWIVVSEDCYVASRADLLPKRGRTAR